VQGRLLDFPASGQSFDSGELDKCYGSSGAIVSGDLQLALVCRFFAGLKSSGACPASRLCVLGQYSEDEDEEVGFFIFWGASPLNAVRRFQRIGFSILIGSSL
jgi:hypothetical protein